MLRLLTVVRWSDGCQVYTLKALSPFLSSVPLASLPVTPTGNILTGLQTDPYAELQISKVRLLQIGRQNPETHIFCRKYKRDPRSF